ncbi:hypothetical protein GJ496_002259 [Pomphorhynchus laevis]|nr:hypothetical protein GJ496_002259 [Pomphorhynchus laevis]
MNKKHAKRKQKESLVPAMKYDARFKILLLGESMVGKTSILQRYVTETCPIATKTTIGVDYLSKPISIDDKIVDLQIWDTAGQEKYRTITMNYVRNSHGVFIIFDLTDMDSFKNLVYWMEFIDKMGLQDAAVIVLGNKCDANEYRMVSDEHTQQVVERKVPSKFLEIPIYTKISSQCYRIHSSLSLTNKSNQHK